MSFILFLLGKCACKINNSYQAHSAAISNQNQVPLVLEYLNKRERFQKAKNKIYAFRVNQIDDNTNKMELYENYEDDGEEGAGEKLLHLLQKMGVENIFIVVCIWHFRMPGQLGTETYKLITIVAFVQAPCAKYSSLKIEKL